MCPSGLSLDRPCARSVKVDCPCVFSQVCVRGGVVWALSEHRSLFYREGVNSYCSEGDSWKYDTIRYDYHECYYCSWRPLYMFMWFSEDVNNCVVTVRLKVWT